MIGRERELVLKFHELLASPFGDAVGPDRRGDVPVAPAGPGRRRLDANRSGRVPSIRPAAYRIVG